MTSPCIKKNVEDQKPCGCFISRMRDRIKSPFMWFLILWLTGLLAVFSMSALVKLFIYVVKKTVH